MPTAVKDAPRTQETEMTTPAAHTGNLEISVSRAELLRELTAAQSVVERKTTIPILSNLLVEAKGSRLTITATDLELSIRTSCDAKVKKKAPGPSLPRNFSSCCACCPKAK